MCWEKGAALARAPPELYGGSKHPVFLPVLEVVPGDLTAWGQPWRSICCDAAARVAVRNPPAGLGGVRCGVKQLQPWNI